MIEKDKTYSQILDFFTHKKPQSLAFAKPGVPPPGVSILQAAPIHFPSGPQYSSPLVTRILALKGQKPLKKVNIMHI